MTVVCVVESTRGASGGCAVMVEMDRIILCDVRRRLSHRHQTLTDPQIPELDSDFDEAHPTFLSPLVDAFKNKKKKRRNR